MNQLQNVFNYHDQQLRTVMILDEPWFVAKDVCKILDLSDVSKAVSRLDGDEKGTTTIPTLGGNQTLLTVNEYGLYSLILTSRKTEAKAFKRWITHEVIPSIRKHGAYLTPNTLEQAISDPDFMIGLLTNLKEERQKRIAAETTVQQQKPKVLFADAVETSESSILIGELSKLLIQNGAKTLLVNGQEKKMGQNNLFIWLRNNGYLCKKQGEMFNLPTQYSSDKGLFEIKKRTQQNPDGSVRVTRTPKVTGKGQIYFINKFLRELETVV
ncbi:MULTISPECIES: phage antirepressor [Bacillati]|uniref:phage antirepressor n=1 Tax=Bacillati TaxID=1783272 RepID=UPI002E1B0C55|nr:phage antirepressor [Heyndrickxia sporothermodurans]